MLKGQKWLLKGTLGVLEGKMAMPPGVGKHKFVKVLP